MSSQTSFKFLLDIDEFEVIICEGNSMALTTSHNVRRMVSSAQ